MSAHNLPTELEEATFPAEGRDTYVDGVGYMRAWGETVPVDGATGYGKGCIFQHTDAASEATILYVNIGDEDAANFNAVTVAAD